MKYNCKKKKKPESLHCTSETRAILLINWTSVKNKNHGKFYFINIDPSSLALYNGENYCADKLIFSILI